MNSYVMVALAAFGIGLVTGKLIYQQPPQLVAVPAIGAVPEEYLAPVSTGAAGIAEGRVATENYADNSDNSQSNDTALFSAGQATTGFSCDGRTMCSQMNSREEAVFFIKNCPNTKMDSDFDGIPCERDTRW